MNYFNDIVGVGDEEKIKKMILINVNNYTY